MSSYFDAAARAVLAAEACGHIAECGKSAAKALNRYKEYLAWIEAHALKIEIPRLYAFRVRLEKLSFYKLDSSIALGVVEQLHDLAHDLGSARIRLRRGGWASDNPYLVDGAGKDFADG